MKIPDLIVYDVKGSAIAFSPKYFRFAKLDPYRPRQKIELYDSSQADIQFMDDPLDVNQKAFNDAKEAYVYMRPNKVEGVIVNTTTLCRGNCDYCCVEPWLNKTAEFVTYENLMATLEAHNSLDTIKDLYLFGGEPLLNFKLLEDILENTDIVVHISTGLFITDKEFKRFMDILEEYGSKINVQVSIDPENKWRTGKNGGEKVYDKCREIVALKNIGSVKINSMLANGDIYYRKFRAELEQIAGKEIYYDFNIPAVDKSLGPTEQDWWIILQQLIEDADEYLAGDRTELPFEAEHAAMRYQNFFEMGADDFYDRDYCEQVTGEIPVIYPDSAEKLEFRRCQTLREWDHTISYEPYDKCKSCNILRYCGASCPYGTQFDSYCDQQLLRVIVPIYIMLHKIDLDKI